MHILRWGCVALATALLAGPAWSQDYPDKPIKVIVPLGPGSITDTTLRVIGEVVSKKLGQPLVIESRPGGSMTIGANVCAKSAPDGYTLCAVSGNVMSFNPATMKQLSYDPEKDFKPITQLYYLIEGVLIGKAANVNSVADLKKLATSKPDAVSFATFGIGDATDMYRMWLGKQWNTKIVGVPYRGGAAIMTALLRGEVTGGLGGLGNAYGQLKSGNIKVLCVRADHRLKALPDVPTEKDVGLPYPGSSPWWGLVAPAGERPMRSSPSSTRRSPRRSRIRRSPSISKSTSSTRRATRRPTSRPS